MNNQTDSHPENSQRSALEPAMTDELSRELGPLGESAQEGGEPGVSGPQWAKLEQQVEELIELTSTLSRENKALRTQQRNWTSERAKLIEKNELAKSRVESMITRLKALEHD